MGCGCGGSTRAAQPAAPQFDRGPQLGPGGDPDYYWNGPERAPENAPSEVSAETNAPSE